MVRRVVSIVAAVGLVAAGLVLSATPAQAGDPSGFNVIKVVQGPVPPGTEFTVDVNCTNNTFDTQLVFPATGGSEGHAVGFSAITCTLTETQTGGASATTFACKVIVGPATCQGTNTVVFTGADRIVEFTVTNTFVPPAPPAPAAAAPAAAVPAAPTFTG